MMPLEPTPAVLLDYIYGLLDETQRREVDRLVAAEPEWRSALEHARGHQSLLAEAAKTSFEGVRFEPPTPRTGHPDREATQILQMPTRRPWLRLAVAASLLFLVVFGAWGGLLISHQHHITQVANNEAEAVRQKRAELEQSYKDEEKTEAEEIRDLQAKIQQLEKQWKGERDKIAEQNTKQDLEVIIHGPKTIQAGAKNQYEIRAMQKHDLGGGKYVKQPVQSQKFEAKVIDPDLPKDKQVVFQQKVTIKQDEPYLYLPPDLPVQPGKKLELQVAALGDAGALALVSEPLPIVGALYLTHLTTDLPLYRPGDKVHFRSLTLDRFSLKPPQETFDLVYSIRAPAAKPVPILQGSTHLLAKLGMANFLLGPDGQPVSGIGTGEYVLPKDAPGGEWVLEVREAHGKFPPQSRKFLVNNYQAPLLNKEVEFTRKSYGPGEEVTVRLKVHRVDGNTPVVNQPVVATVHVDDVANIKVEPANPVTDKNGQVEVHFSLPGKDKITDGQGSIAFQCFDGAHSEPAVRPIPITLNRLDISFYPEGGDLVASVPNRVYFEVKAKNGKPAELSGWLVNGQGEKVEYKGKPVAIKTFHDDKDVGANQGLGLFEFVPAAKESYALKIDTPIGIEGKHVLPMVQKDGVVLSVAPGVISDKILLSVTSAAKERKLLVGAYCRGQMLAQTTVTAPAGQATPVTLTPADKVSGVYRITVFEYRDAPNTTHLVPVAERLIFRRPVEKLNFTVTSSKGTFAPGEPVKVTIDARDEAGQAKPAIVLVKVVNQSTLKLADDKTLQAMPTYFYLTTEIKSPEDLEYADFLVSDNAKAETTLDLLLGTQGWRRFLEQAPEGQKMAAMPKVAAATAQPMAAGVQPPAGAVPQPAAPVQPPAVPVHAVPVQKEQKDIERLLIENGQKQTQNVNVTRFAELSVDRQYADKWLKEQQKLAKSEQTYSVNSARRGEQIHALQQKILLMNQGKSASDEDYGKQLHFLVQMALGTLATVLLVVGVFALILGLMRRAEDRRAAHPYIVTGVASLTILFFMVCITLLLTIGGGLGRGGAEDSFFGGRKEAAQGAPGAVAENKAMAPPMAADNKPPEMPMPPAPGGPFNKFAPGPMPVPGGGAPGAVAPPGMPKFGPDAKNGKAAIAMAPMLPEVNGGAAFGGANDAQLAQKDMPPAMMMPGNKGPGFAKGFPAGKAFDEQLLRRHGEYLQLAQHSKNLQGILKGIPFGELQQMFPSQGPPLVVREYAHVHIKSDDGVRRDFANTLYWQPALVLTNGSGQVEFDMGDNLATYEITVWGHTLDGRLGAATQDIDCKLPVALAPRVPAEISSADKVTIPVKITNDTLDPLTVKLNAKAENLDFLGNAEESLKVNSQSNNVQHFTLKANKSLGEAKLIFTGDFGPFGKDSVEKTFKIVPEGFPSLKALSDMMEGRQATHKIALPQQWVKGSVKLRVQVFPSTLADLQKGLEGMLREPCGCFEQSSSSNYPNVMILSYLKESDQGNAAIEDKARKLMTSGYGKLTGFECLTPPNSPVQKKGYEWFGGKAPPHEALTAYGLLQFGDMQKVGFPVDVKMMERTEQYLLDQRDGKGGFKKNPLALDSFGRAPAHITDAYIVWALTEYGSKADLSRELEALQEKAKSVKDPYFLALVSLSLRNAGKTAEAVELLKKVRESQQADGGLTGAQTSITSSGGRDLQIETTSLAVLGWLRANRPADFQTNIQKGAQWLGKQRGGYGGFGSTQSTILALKALVAHAKENKKTAEAGELRLFVNDSKLPVETLTFPAGCTDELIVHLPDESLLKPGENTIRIELTGDKNVFPYTLTYAYNTLKPDNTPDCPVHLVTKLDRTNAKDGETVKMTATVENKSGKGQGMAIAVLGLPAGLRLPGDMKQLQELKKAGTIAEYEIKGRELILYWRDLAPDQKITVHVDLTCDVPGEFRGPASRAYLYYQSDLKYWTDPLRVTIEP